MAALLDELQMLAGNPVAWGAVPVLALFVLTSIWHWWTCPLIARTASITLEQARAVVGQPRIAGPRYFLLMMGGIVATLAGLTLIAEGIYPLLAFYLLLGGVFVIQTEPTRLQIRESEMAVVAARAHGEEAMRIAVERLETTAMWLMTIQCVMLAATVAFLLAF